MDIRLKQNPFFLNDADIKWIEKVKSEMSFEEKVGQLFVPLGLSDKEEYLRHLVNDCHVGGIMYRTGKKVDVRSTHERIQKMAKIPLLLAANIESGGDGICFEGTSFGKPMVIAATNDSKNAYRMGYVACKEGASVGLNWSFAPIVDIDYDFKNPITNVRTFGSNPNRVKEMGAAYMEGAKANDVAVAIKHFPGDGCDERDQHIVTSVNPMSCEEWDATYGDIYQELIDKGAQSVMVGHIAQPAYVKQMNPNATVEEQYYPASVSRELVTGLLREKLGFNGVITTDSTCMVGYTTAMKREESVVASIAAGCDIILFNKSLDEDIDFVKKGILDGRITKERFEDAVTRVLALKASLKLHIRQQKGELVPPEEQLSVVGCEEHNRWAEKVAEQSVTLVKDTQQLLPISPKKYKRIYLNVIQRKLTDSQDLEVQKWRKLFEREGFDVTVRDRSVTLEAKDLMGFNLTSEKEELIGELYRSIHEFVPTKDLYVYVFNIENASNNTTARLDWNVIFGLGDDVPWFTKEIPTLFISTANPYHLFDAPMAKTLINSYSNSEIIMKEIMDKIMGRTEFVGQSPVDPFCQKEYLRL
ncbi:glycoside hydrolase family 3 protein [Streptococcus moroccensis]|uniref:beta-N-acetylhexosaminidase n=1 Tax=Streptococcus moroccensis TaxID=1451356 RepID=A0ABT9YUV7_9STRE|nr:glycoside hydrolase family 3 N-terminal domain-containing protein [Streptococcus moroccensis]MDQ0223575.1 beta-N-acetylhexosaminidase [Streptococcus moroccensis]